MAEACAGHSVHAYFPLRQFCSRRLQLFSLAQSDSRTREGRLEMDSGNHRLDTGRSGQRMQFSRAFSQSCLYSHCQSTCETNQPTPID
eukprot:2101353-Pyramimonas_sp.AAC.2